MRIRPAALAEAHVSLDGYLARLDAMHGVHEEGLSIPSGQHYAERPADRLSLGASDTENVGVDFSVVLDNVVVDS